MLPYIAPSSARFRSTAPSPPTCCLTTQQLSCNATPHSSHAVRHSPQATARPSHAAPARLPPRGQNVAPSGSLPPRHSTTQQDAAIQLQRITPPWHTAPTKQHSSSAHVDATPVLAPRTQQNAAPHSMNAARHTTPMPFHALPSPHK